MGIVCVGWLVIPSFMWRSMGNLIWSVVTWITRTFSCRLQALGLSFCLFPPTPGCLFTSQVVRRWVTFVPCAETIILVLDPCWGVWGDSWGVNSSSCSSRPSFGIYLPHDGFEPPPSVKLRVDFVFISFHSAFPSAFVCVVCLVQCPLVIWCDSFVYPDLVPLQALSGVCYVLVFVALLLPPRPCS